MTDQGGNGMSVKSELMKRLGSRVRTMSIELVSSGFPVLMNLTHVPQVNTPAAAEILLKRHVTLKTAYTALTEMLREGESVILVPMVEDVAILQEELLSVGVIAKVKD